MHKVKRLDSLAMRLLLIGLMLSTTAAVATQQPTSQSQHATFIPTVRLITVEPISTSRDGLPTVPFTAFLQAWQANNVGLAVESKLDVSSVEKAAKIIRDIYKSKGSPVRVEHRINQMSSGSSVEVAFRVIELCYCDE
jgi:hypothetical protein